jgi:hypothetical protein
MALAAAGLPHWALKKMGEPLISFIAGRFSCAESARRVLTQTPQDDSNHALYYVVHCVASVRHGFDRWRNHRGSRLPGSSRYACHLPHFEGGLVLCSVWISAARAFNSVASEKTLLLGSVMTLPFRASPFVRGFKRLFLGPRTLESASYRQEILCPEERAIMRPAIFLPGQVDLITGTRVESAKEAQIAGLTSPPNRFSA